ncbi:nucleotidyltransferase family protein [Brucella pituitosa]|uniref:nucleotidyltransferase family protein n=1 Tax=Brucella pituitosa TaxID=571256 RepID=UPI003F4AE3E4
MSRTPQIAIIVLAAGKSRRFGAADKLLSFHNGKPLAAHVASSLRGLPYSFGVVVARNPSVAKLFQQTRLQYLFPQNTSSQSDTLKAGLAFVEKRGASHVLLVLADMPNISRAHLKELTSRIGYQPRISNNGSNILPPALIPRSLFGKLRRLHGDSGAGKILRAHYGTIKVPLSKRDSLDIDCSNKGSCVDAPVMQEDS